MVLIGVAIGGLACYLSVETFEEAREVIQRILQLGTVNIILFVIIYYGAKLFLILSRKEDSPIRFFRVSTLAGMFGVASVLTMLFLPPLLGDPSLASDSGIAITLTTNVIADVFILLYQTIAILLWNRSGEYSGYSE